jgi:hypothetical protein
MDYSREWDSEGLDHHETFEDGWFENSKGNWVWWIDGGARATVYNASNDMWAAVWNGAADGRSRRLKRRFEDAGDAIEAVEEADQEGDDSPLWFQPDGGWWTKNKKGEGFHCKVDGTTFSVKQAKSGSWYAVTVDGMLGQNGAIRWHRTVEEARQAVDEFLVGKGGWHLINSR